jgi:hypothetical protein
MSTADLSHQPTKKTGGAKKASASELGHHHDHKCPAHFRDCHGDCGGTAYLDCHGICCAGKTGKECAVPDCNGECGGCASKDCDGVCNGTAVVDCAGHCCGGETCKECAVRDCAGTCNGSALPDCDGVCGGNKVRDCHGVCGGDSVPDCHGVCGGTAAPDCAGICDGPHRVDCNNVCGGNACVDCAGVCGGSATKDCDGICEGCHEIDCSGQCCDPNLHEGEGSGVGCDVPCKYRDCAGECGGCASPDCAGCCNGDHFYDCAGKCQKPCDPEDPECTGDLTVNPTEERRKNAQNVSKTVLPNGALPASAKKGPAKQVVAAASKLAPSRRTVAAAKTGKVRAVSGKGGVKKALPARAKQVVASTTHADAQPAAAPVDDQAAQADQADEHDAALVAVADADADDTDVAPLVDEHEESCEHDAGCDQQHDCGAPCNHNDDPSSGSEVPPFTHQTQHIAHPRRAMPQLDSRAYNSKPSSAPKPTVGKKQTLGHKPVTQKFKYR